MFHGALVVAQWPPLQQPSVAAPLAWPSSFLLCSLHFQEVKEKKNQRTFKFKAAFSFSSNTTLSHLSHYT